MYLHTFGLREPPFAEAPDPRFACLFTRERELLAHCEYALLSTAPAVILLTGDAGVGKTLLCMLLEAEMAPHGVRTATLNSAVHSQHAADWLRSLYLAFGLPLPLSAEANTESHLIDGLAMTLGRLSHQGQRFLLVIDDASDLREESFSLLDQLMQAAEHTHAWLHIVLAGEPGLRDRLQEGAARAIDARIRTRLPLATLSPEESERYVRHRLHIAGTTRMPFSRLGLRSLCEDGEGSPARLNALANRALERAGERGEQSIGERTLAQAAQEVLPQYARYWLRRYRRLVWIAGAAITLLVIAGVAGYFLSGRSPSRPKNLVTVSPEQALSKLRDALPAPEVGQLRVWGELLARWQVGSKETSVANAINCDATIFPGFACVSGRGSLDQLRRFDRPMVLELDDSGKKQQVLLVGAGDTTVRLYLGGKYVELARTAFQDIWKGQFYAVFRVDPNMPSRLKRGDNGEGMRWLLAHLTDGSTAAITSADFDRGVETRVKLVQERFGIAADGIVGPETMFALSATDQDGPHLVRNVP
ncbi:type II secretion system protein A [Luteibacter rhizovicinus]|uniref:Type II secretion system protein A n=1 Tax=Luteibacter rhizovicinus TaxID=242606 RepID=A0A4R3YMU5_9GAMM|nr:AAA family ATPase [Luteibacter rhizovicinus]TCV92444.1 type II secretion system protein A [Luteibacter rhizovicinus]